jgi:hypothetical protein
MTTRSSQEIAQAVVAAVPALYSSVGEAIVATHDRMQCHICLRVQPLTAADAAFYTRRGWPKCHGRTMRMVAKEEPTHE